MDFMDLIVNKGIAVAAGLYIIGVFLKKAVFIPDWLIPFILLALGILASCFTIEGGFTVPNILQGIFATGLAVLGNQAYKQISTRDPGDAFVETYGGNDPDEEGEL
ncbi:MAG: phage holin family protein [Eubacteriales bacterium]